MPSSKEIRARQNRQKERIAVQHAERQRVRTRNRRIGIAVGTVLVIAAVAVVYTQLVDNNGKNASATTPTTSAVASTTTPAALASAKGKPCVGLKAPLPKGAPAFTIPKGPAPTTLSTRDLKVGTGAVIPQNATVTVNYVGVACSTGKIFDSSYSRNQPFQANLKGGVIQGWEKGIPGMHVGGVRVIAIPSNLAYGPQGNAGIAPDEALYFLVAPVKLG
jgi:FKBP-type peptidyl-prolyl cis-trans isomerase